MNKNIDIIIIIIIIIITIIIIIIIITILILPRIFLFLRTAKISKWLFHLCTIFESYHMNSLRFSEV